MNPDEYFSLKGKYPKGIARGRGMSAITKYAGPDATKLPGFTLAFVSCM